MNTCTTHRTQTTMMMIMTIVMTAIISPVEIPAIKNVLLLPSTGGSIVGLGRAV